MGHKPSRVVYHLPQELTDHVISFLVDDTPALEACSLVCTSWSAKSTLLLFKTLSVDWESIGRLVGGRDRVRNAVWHLHLGCESHYESERCCEHTIYHLREGLEHRSAASWALRNYQRCRLVSTGDLVEIISLCPRLKIATLYNLHLGDVVVSEITSMELQLQKLVLVNVWGIDAYPAVLARFLSSFKSIGYLKVFVDPYIAEPQVDDSDVPGLEGDVPLPEGTVSIQTISLNAPNAAIFRSLEQCYRPQDLTRLDVVMNISHRQWDVPLIRRFVEHSTALRELSLDLPFYSWDVYRWICPWRGRVPRTPFKLPDLSGHSHLRIIHIHGIGLQTLRTGTPSEADETSQTVWPELICMLASASSTLRVVCIHAKTLHMFSDLNVLDDRPLEFENYDWNTLGKKLATLRALWRIYVVLDARVGEVPAALASAPAWTEATERLEIAMPSEVRAKLVFGVWRRGQLYRAK